MKKTKKISKPTIKSKKIVKPLKSKQSNKGAFLFSGENYINPNLPKGLKTINVKLVKATV